MPLITKALIAIALGAAASCGSEPIEALPPTETLEKSELVATISTGDDVDLESFLDDEQWTLFEYGADW